MSQIKSSETHRTLNICINFRADNRLPSCGAVGSRELADALEAEARAQALCMEDPNFREAYEAFIEKRSPVFQ